MNSDVSEGTGFADVAMQLQDQILETQDVEQILTNLADYAAARLGDAGPGLLCGITLTRPKKPAARVGSTSHARLLEQLEGTYGDGPGTSAARIPGTVVVPDFRREERWPDYILAGRRQGIQFAASTPLLLEGDDRGVLSLYSEQPDALGPEGIARAEAFVHQASKGLRLALRVAKLQDTKDGLSAAMQTRTVIDVATGAIMAQNRCSQAEAFKVLREASNSRNTKLREIAAVVVSSLTGGSEATTYFDE